MNTAACIKSCNIRILCVLMIALLVGAGVAEADVNDRKSSQKEDACFKDAQGNILCGVPEIDRLVAEARVQYYRYGNLAAADSLATLAIQQAGMTYRTSVMLQSLNAFLGMCEQGYDNTKAVNYARQAEELVLKVDMPELVWNTYINFAKVWNSEFSFDNALGFAYKSLAAAESANIRRMKILSLIQIGNILQNSSQTIESLRYFLNALTIAEASKDPDLLTECYETLSLFYEMNKGYDKAINYKMKEIDLINTHKPLDSIALYWAYISLEKINFCCNNKVQEERLEEIIAFAVKQKNNYMKQYVLAMFRSYLMNNNLFQRLRELYIENYPEELTYLSIQQPGVYFRLKAIFMELDNQIDSAYTFYAKAEEIAVQGGSKVMAANALIRFGEFLQRTGRDREATGKYMQAFELASMTGFFEYALKAAKVLEEIHENSGNFREALHFAQLTRSISDSIARMNRKEEILAMEIRNTENIRKMELKEELLSTRRKYNIQYTFILLLILTFFAVLVTIGNFRVSATAVKVLGFISLIFLFEFIILLTDNQIHQITHGEPLKVLAIKVVLISFLLPLHHWTEKKIIYHLLNRKIIKFEKRKLMAIMRNLKTTATEIWGR